MSETNKTLEQRAAETLLQKGKDVTIGGKTYRIAPPSIATLILVSEAISHLPAVKTDTEQVTEEVLARAGGSAPIGDALAVFILGAKRIRAQEEQRQREQAAAPRRRWWQRRRKVSAPAESEREALARTILEELTPRETFALFASVLREMQLTDFFGLTTFLSDVNLLRATREVVPPTTTTSTSTTFPTVRGQS